MGMELQHRLRTKGLGVAHNFFSKSGDANKMLDTAEQQLCNYRATIVPPSDPTGRVVIKYSGKADGERDDTAVAMQLALYWSGVWLKKR